MDYHQPDSFAEAVVVAAEDAGSRAWLRGIGATVESRPIDAVTVAAPGRDHDPSRPQVVVIGAIHGCEVIASQLALAILEIACAEPPLPDDVAALLDVADLTVVPCVNVDGRTESLRSREVRRPLVAAPRRNVNGVDLNRNWPFPDGVEDHWLPIAGTERSWLPWYRGPAPLSEPETKAVAGLVEELRPVGLLNLHSTGCILTYPWGSKSTPPDDEAGFLSMTEAFRSRQRYHRYRTKQSRAWYPIVGSSNDYFYDRYGTLAITVETSPPAAAVKAELRRAGRMFWYANPTNPARWVANDLMGSFAALEAAVAYRRDYPLEQVG